METKIGLVHDWNAVRAVLRGNFRAFDAYVKKQKSSETGDLSFCLRKLEKEEQMDFKACREKEMKMLSANVIKIDNNKASREN